MEEVCNDILSNFKTLYADQQTESQTQDKDIINNSNTDATLKNIITKQQEQISASTAVRNASDNKLIDSEMKKLVLNQYINRAPDSGDRYGRVSRWKILP